ncbi:MAG: tetratricopeptide repeat protein [Woeseiaceae bacterium]
MAAANPQCRLALILTLFFALPGVGQAQQTMQLADSGDARDLYQQAESLLAGGNTRNAYELLRAYESEFSGNPYFDYLLGVAALDSGRSSEAILALRRATAGAPQFSGARMELARALYDAGEFAEARPMFEALLTESPPPAVRDIIAGYINAIDIRPTSPPSRFLPYGELLTGHDSNANGATDNEVFLGFILSPENIKTDTLFVEAAAGFDWRLPRSTNFGWFVGARASYRDNPDAEFVDSLVVAGLLSMNWRNGAVFGQAGISGFNATRDGDSNESYRGYDVMLGRNLSERWDLRVAVRGGALDYAEAIEVLDVNRTMYSLAASFRFASRGRVSFEAIGGGDDEQESGSPYGNSKEGGRLGLIAPLSDSAYLIASLDSISSDYDGLFFGAPREDTQITSLLQFEFRDVWTEGLTLAPRLRYVENDSDVDLYTYNRTEVGLMIRWAPK